MTTTTWQTSHPIARTPLSVGNRGVVGLVRALNAGDITVDTPYQRGSVWTTDQRIGLIKSLMQGLPIPAIITNNRLNPSWSAHHGTELEIGEPCDAVVDGKQRLLAVKAWIDGDLAVPASWFPDDEIESTTITADGQYVTYEQLSAIGRRIFANRALLPVADAALASLEEEAELFLLVNGAGTPQTSADLERAGQVAAGGWLL